jgi:hypothetical protein
VFNSSPTGQVFPLQTAVDTQLQVAASRISPAAQVLPSHGSESISMHAQDTASKTWSAEQVFPSQGSSSPEHPANPRAPKQIKVKSKFLIFFIF